MRSLITVGLLAITAPALVAQTAVRAVPDAADCRACVVNLRPVATLDTGDSVLVSIPDHVAVRGDGSVLVAEFRELPRLFSSSGSYQGDIGVRGGGPGEFTVIAGFSALPGDSILVHLNDGRAVVLDPYNAPRRQITFPAVMHPMRVLEWPRRVVAAGSPGSPPSAGSSLHVLDASDSPARIVSSFGADRDRSSADAGAEMPHLLSTPRGGTFWSVDPLEYRMSKWNASGERLAHLTRSPAWFSGRSRAWLGNPTTPPPPSVVGFTDDADGLLWVYLRVASKDWKAAWPQVARGTREILSTSLDREKLFDIIVEIIDPVSGKVVARQNLPHLVTHVLDNGDVVTQRSRANGSQELRILRPSLRRP